MVPLRITPGDSRRQLRQSGQIQARVDGGTNGRASQWVTGYVEIGRVLAAPPTDRLATSPSEHSERLSQG